MDWDENKNINLSLFLAQAVLAHVPARKRCQRSSIAESSRKKCHILVC